MKRTVSTLLLLFISSGLLRAQDLASFEKQELISGKDTLRYRILYPTEYRPEKKISADCLPPWIRGARQRQ